MHTDIHDIHACTHTYLHACAHIYIAYIRAYIHACMHRTHAYIRTLPCGPPSSTQSLPLASIAFPVMVRRSHPIRQRIPKANQTPAWKCQPCTKPNGQFDLQIILPLWAIAFLHQPMGSIHHRLCDIVVYSHHTTVQIAQLVPKSKMPSVTCWYCTVARQEVFRNPLLDLEPSLHKTHCDSQATSLPLPV